ncbi:uncharacterized protein LOC134840724 [Symsagittifera roscoffensis]|uniref:uncharacterized protein LOC134840724 n=1 Tax=Symsagittifera roscoffensis TaxID=84072 RepID=UPI00307B4CEC
MGFGSVGFVSGASPKNNIALLKLTYPIGGKYRVIPLCSEVAETDTLLGSCGIGTMDTKLPSAYPQLLKEAYFTEDKRSSMKHCREDLICVNSVFYESHRNRGDRFEKPYFDARVMNPFAKSNSGTMPTENIRVEVGDFTRTHSVKDLYYVERKFAPIGFVSGASPKNNIALLKLTYPIGGKYRVIPLCSEVAETDTLLGSCGMGTMDTKLPSAYPQLLKEAYFTEDKRSPMKHCREDLICVSSVFYESNMCFGDSGGPIYTMFCGTRVPQCLYGIYSHTTKLPVTPFEHCTANSFFTSVPYFESWIKKNIELF